MLTRSPRGLLILSMAALAGCSSPSKGYVTSAQAQTSRPLKHVEPSKRPIPAQTVDLKFIETPENQLGCYYGSRDDKLTQPFPNATGKLTIEIRGGKVYGDTNGDGVIDAKDAPPVEPNKGILKFDMKMPGGRTVAFPVRIGEYQTRDRANSDPYLGLCWLGALEATAGDWTIRYAALGFADAPAAMFSNVKIVPAGSDPGQGSYVAASQTYCIGDRLYSVKLSDDLTKLSIAPYTGEVARVRFFYTLAADAPAPSQEPWNRDDHSSISLRHKDGVQNAEAPAGMPAKFVPGEYQDATVFLTRYINHGEQLYISGRLDPKISPIILKPGMNEICVGAPFKMDFIASRDGNQVELTDVQLTGRLGESYRPPGQGGKTEFAAYIRAAGKETQLAKLEYG